MNKNLRSAINFTVKRVISGISVPQVPSSTPGRLLMTPHSVYLHRHHHINTSKYQHAHVFFLPIHKLQHCTVSLNTIFHWILCLGGHSISVTNVFILFFHWANAEISLTNPLCKGEHIIYLKWDTWELKGALMITPRTAGINWQCLKKKSHLIW